MSGAGGVIALQSALAALLHHSATVLGECVCVCVSLSQEISLLQYRDYIFGVLYSALDSTLVAIHWLISTGRSV